MMSAPGRCLGKMRKYALEIIAICDGRDQDLQSQHLSPGLNVAHERRAGRVIRIHQHRHRLGCRGHLMHQLQPLCTQRRGQVAHAGGVAARPTEAGHEAGRDRVGGGHEHDRDRRRGRLCDNRRLRGAGDDHRHLTADQVGRQCRQASALALRPAVLDREISTLDEAELVQPSAQRGQKVRGASGRARPEEPDHRHRRLLRACRQRPHCRAAES